MNMKRMSLVVMVVSILLGQPNLSTAKQPRAILKKIGATRGICVLLGDMKCKLALGLAQDSELLIYVQLPGTKDVQTACSIVDKAGLYGTRIFIEKGDLKELHLADNIADVLIAEGSATGISEAELLRVLRPQGKALLGRKVHTKPFPEGVDDWSHPYHGPDNNPQSEDRVIRAPYLTQFLAEPRYAPVPQVAVASAGRVFKAFGHVAFKRREEPYLNKLVAFNGYNGTILWQRDLAEGVMIHRNTIIATPTTLYVGDDKSCKLIDVATGQLKDEIIPPTDIAGGTFWKWMALEDGVLYALIGEQEQRDPTMRWRRQKHGWPWNPISKGFNQPDRIKDSQKAYLAHPWGFGRNVLAIDPETKKVLWHYHEDEPIDSRAMCMKNGRVYIFRFGAYLACLDAKTGSLIWRKTPDNAPELFESLGRYMNRQGAPWNWRTTAYLKCSDRALYFAGPQVGKLLAVSAKDGSILWENPYSNFQLVLREDGLYGISGQNDVGSASMKFDPLTGRILAQIKTGRRSCTRPTGAQDAIFYRARGGSTRLDLQSLRPGLVSPMRPPCHDGVTIANGLLYWWPYACDCLLTLYGVTSLAPAGDFDFTPQATETERLETAADSTKVASFSESSADWPTFRADNTCSATTKAAIPEDAKLLWRFDPKTNVSPAAPLPTAPVTAGGLVFVSGPDGIVRALDAATGKLRWKAYTGGAVRIPPTIWKGRAYVGSGDGWVYAFEARTGRLLWRFRAAPAARKIPVYDSLLSTWPAASGVLVEDGVAYVAAGIVNYDGTYVFALDAVTGRIKWQNNTSGHLDRQARTGVSVQGHLLLNDGKLYLAGGNAVSPAIYDATDGRCLNNPEELGRLVQNNLVTSQSPRGWELFLLGDSIVACGKPFYAHPKYRVFDDTVFNKVFLTSSRGRDIVWASSQTSSKVMCFAHIDMRLLRNKLAQRRNRFNVDWARLGIKDKPLWNYDCAGSVAVAVCSNAVVVARESEILALNLQDGKVLWSQPVPLAPVPWGLAIERDGRVIVTLEDGQVLCFG
ncbi:MAG: PQQ-binding-like beta-propeller repeat protein [Sedimentisphaerales bacterium]